MIAARSLSAIRLDRGLTQKDLAERLGVHIMTVSSYERGRLTPSLKMLRRIATELGVEISEIDLASIGTEPDSTRTANGAQKRSQSNA